MTIKGHFCEFNLKHVDCKAEIWWRIMGVWLWNWNQSPSMEPSRRAKAEKEHIKFVEMWRYCSLFSSIAMAWCIMISCYKVARLIRNTTLKLCGDCEKQFVRNAQNCEKTNHRFCTMLTHQLIHRWLCVSFWPKTEP